MRIATPVQARLAPGLQWSPAGSAEELCSEAQAMPLGGFALARNDRRGKRAVAAHSVRHGRQSVIGTPLIRLLRRHLPPRGKAL